MEENKNLKLEIEVLKKRVAALENKERRRKIVGLIKAIIMVVLIVFVSNSACAIDVKHSLHHKAGLSL